jgi:SWI/SNF-related matrix-associated actin-dependent regulator 1 of chromatin subfamily A
MNAISILKKGDRWVAMFRWSVELKDKIKTAGFKFDGTKKEWWTSDAAIAASFNGAAPAPQNDYHADSAPASFTKNDIGRNGKPSFEIPAPDGLAYLPFQWAGIAAMTTRKDSLLADEMGLGKTVQAIGLINAKPEIKRVLIVCPASLKINWKNELIRWCHRPMTILVLSSGDVWQPCDIVITNYEQVPRYRGAIDHVNWDLLICDESHYLKNSKAQRTHAVLGRWDDVPANRIYPIKATRRLFMTGTPILNRPKELWTTVRALDRQGLGRDWMAFHTRYCNAYQDEHGWQLDGASHLEELQDRLRGSIMVRRLKKDVLPELPPKRRQIITLPAETLATKHMLKVEAELAKTEAEMTALRAKVEALSVNQADAAYKKAVQALEEFEGVAFSATAKIRHQTALAKLPGAMDYLINVLNSEEKIVVFTHHRDDMIDPIIEGLAEYGVVKMDGRDNVAQRQAAVHAFQTDPKIRVIVGTMAVMGAGHTLHAASYVAFIELDWVPGNLAQAEDRLHRIGQKNSILVQHLVLEGSFDGRMAGTVVRKMQTIERAVG